MSRRGVSPGGTAPPSPAIAACFARGLASILQAKAPGGGLGAARGWKKQTRAPAGVRGKKIRCKSCGHVSPARPAGKAAPGRPKASAPGRPAPDDDEEDANPYAVADLSLAPRCPHCAADMEPDAVVCLSCGYN